MTVHQFEDNAAKGAQGYAINWDTAEARVKDLKAYLMNAPQVMDPERLQFLNEVYEEFQGEPVFYIRAKLLERVLTKKKIFLDGNPIVGTLTGTRAGVYAYPEWNVAWIKEEMQMAKMASLGEMKIPQETTELLEKTYKKWKGRTCIDLNNKMFKDKYGFNPAPYSKAGVYYDNVSVASGSGIADYPLALNKGLRWVIDDIKKRLLECPTTLANKEKHDLYRAMIVATEAVIAHSHRYADLAEKTAGYLLGTGDKYARYYTANAYTELMNIQSGKILGIGVELGIDQTGYAKVTRVYDGSPAQEAGIAVGDYITTVGDTDIKSLSGADAVYKALQGEAGTTVTVTWLDSTAASKTAELTHSGYTSTTVDYQLLDNVGYIRIRQFDGTTPSELDYALRTLTANGAASLVFDLRDNGGGILEDAVNCIDLIAPEGTVAYAEDKNGNRTVIGSSDAESAVSLPMVCLVNGNTASAAELFAATLRTMNGARLVGTTTMGKGTIQSSPQRLSDGSAVVITVAKLVCGDGSCFDGTGLTVDVERALSTEEATNFYDYTPQTDPQVQRAVSAAQQLSGTTTLAGASSAAAADSAASSAAADDTAPAEAAEGETAASEPETAASAAE